MNDANKLGVLEAARGFAATYVFLHHLNPLAGTAAEPLFRAGQEAVILFFLVSGFVIYFSTYAGRAVGLAEFAAKRALRIYPLFLISLGLAAIVESLRGNGACVNTASALANIFMLQDISYKPGVVHGVFCDNDPLWSLSYEWWFYTLFAILFFIAPGVSFRGKRWTAALLSIGGAIVYQLAPNQPALFLAYFWIWWAGVELAREYLETQRVTFSAQRPALAVLGLCTAIWAWPVFAAVRAHAALSPGLHPVLEFRHFAAASLMLVAGIWYLSTHRRPTRAGRLFAWMAPISYGLYISHRPVINAIQMAGLPRVLTIALTVVAALAMAYLLEIVIHPWCVRRMKSLWRAAARRGKTAGAASIVKVRS